MKTLAFFALLALTATAFNLAEYQTGYDSFLFFNQTESQDGATCLNAISSDIQNIITLIQTHNFDNIALDLGKLFIQVQHDLEDTCEAYINDHLAYFASNDILDFPETAKKNLLSNYAVIIHDIALWINLIQTGQDEYAGSIQAQILQILMGFQNDNSDSIPVTPVPFNATEFIQEFYPTLFQTLGMNVEVNASGILECMNSMQTAVVSIFELKEKFITMDFEQRLNGVQYAIGLGFDAVRNCGAVWEMDELLLAPIVKVYKQDPVNFIRQILGQVAMQLPVLIDTVKTEIQDIQAGAYSAAGIDEAGLFFDLFENSIEFGSSN